jgi:hypothetical protein
MAPIERKRQLNVNLSEGEFGRLEQLANDRGVTSSDVVRLLIRREFEVSAYLTPLESDHALAAAAQLAQERNPGGRHAPKSKKR